MHASNFFLSKDNYSTPELCLPAKETVMKAPLPTPKYSLEANHNHKKASRPGHLPANSPPPSKPNFVSGEWSTFERGDDRDGSICPIHA
jgi:hypothetical protein